MSEQTPAKVDAVLVTAACTAIRKFRTDPELCLYFNRTYGPVLGAPRVFTRHVLPSHDRLLTAGGTEVRYFPEGHPLAGQERYAWAEAGDGVFHGTLVPEPPDAAA